MPHNRSQDDAKPHRHPRHFDRAIPFSHCLRQTILSQSRRSDTNRVFDNEILPANGELGTDSSGLGGDEKVMTEKRRGIGAQSHKGHVPE